MRSMSFVVLFATLCCPSVGAQWPQTNWIEVASSLGGSGHAPDGRYVLLLRGGEWGDHRTPSSWLELARHGKEFRVRGSLPLLRSQLKSRIALLANHLPVASRMTVRDAFRATDPRVWLRFEAFGKDTSLAASLRKFFRQTQGQRFGRLVGHGIVRKDRHECETDWAIATLSGEVLIVDKLPVDLRVEGTRVHFAARRRNARLSRFLYYGGVKQWRSMVKLESVGPASRLLPSVPPPPTAKTWTESCRVGARELLALGTHEQALSETPLASGFEAWESTGFKVCPRCQRRLQSISLIDAPKNEPVETILSLCARDSLYYLSRKDHDYGPFRPNHVTEKKR